MKAFLAMPYAYYDYDDPTSEGKISRLSYQNFLDDGETRNYFVADCFNGLKPLDDCKPSSTPQPRAEAVKDDVFFKEYCPMFLKDGQETCANFKYQRSAFEGDKEKAEEYYLKLTNIENEFDNYFNDLYPRCHDLIYHLPCAMFHPDLSEMSYEIGRYHDEESKNIAPIFSFSLCEDLTEKIYHECRYAYYSKLGEKKRIVPEGFTLNDFKKLVHTPDSTVTDPKCVNLEFLNSDAPFVLKPQNILLLATAIISLFLIL